MSKSSVHISVLLDEVIQNFKNCTQESESKVFIDCTLGAGGHAEGVLETFPKCRLIAFDVDTDAIKVAKKRLERFGARCLIINKNYSSIKEVVSENSEWIGEDSIAGVLADLGVSSIQLDSVARGFSYRACAHLDMRMGEAGLSAAEVLNTYTFGQLVRVFKTGGAHKEARQLANAVINARPLKTTDQLANICKDVQFRMKVKKGNFTSLVFQAVRMEVNQELKHLKQFLDDSIEVLSPKGILQVISFHSLEDKLVASKMRQWMQGVEGERMLPNVNTSIGRLVTKKAVLPTEREMEINPRSRSAMLRVFIKQ